MKKQSKQALSTLLAGVMLVGALSGCQKAPANPSGSATPSASTPPVAASYPMDVEELGSGTPKWTEEKTKDGWMRVTNEGGATLGYSPDSGVKLIQVDGLAFKDLNKNGKLDGYEDWRQDAGVRATDLASQLSPEEIFPLMIHESTFSITTDVTEEDFKTKLDNGERTVLNFATSDPVGIQVKWNNSVQAYTEALDFGIPVNISTNPRNRNTDAFPNNLALSATFDPDLVFDVSAQMAKRYRSLGVATLLGPQVDLTTEPRWSRIDGAYGEDPALSRDLTNATISAYQSTYDENGTDLGWGTESVIAMVKHFPGDGAAESGREAHNATGKFNVYPGGQFATHLIPFFDGAMHLDSITGQAASVMPSYSIAWSDDESLGDLVGSAFSEYKLNILRENGYDELICSDWGVTKDIGSSTMKVAVTTPWGVEDITGAERAYMGIVAGVDQFGYEDDITVIADAYALLVEDIGEEDATVRFQDSARRITKTFFMVGLFDNPYVSAANADACNNGDDVLALGRETQLKSIVMLKNSENTIQTATSEEKATVYIPMQYAAGSGWSLPVDEKTANEYYNVITDTVGDPTGPADKDGKATVSESDIIRASASDLANCSAAIIMVKDPQNDGNGYDATAEKYIPISLQYGDYTATSDGVRTESLAGDLVETEVENTYGVQKVKVKENRSYYGESSKITNKSDLDGILYAVENMPADAKIIVAVNATRPMILTEFEDKVDAILMGFKVNNKYFLEIASGKTEPSGLLPLQMPANMETVEAQMEDVPRDMECYVDADGNTYDFAYGMNWSGVISDARTEKYSVPALTTPETITID